MKPTVKGEQVQLAGYFDELIPHPLAELDRTAFLLHSYEIEKNAKEGFKDWETWTAKRQIIENYCKRTGVNFKKFLHYASGKYWLQIQLHLLAIKKI